MERRTIVFKDPSGTAVTTDTTYNMCSGPQEFRASGGRSYEFRIDGTVVYTTSSTADAIEVTFDPLTDFTTSTYVLTNNDVVDVIVYDLPLTASGTIDSAACGFSSADITVNVSATPSVTLTGSFGNYYCPSETVTFTILPNFGVSSSTTYEYHVTGMLSFAGLTTTTVFAHTMPNVPGSVATVTIRATDPFCSGSPVESVFTFTENEITFAGTISATDGTLCSGSIPLDIVETVAPTTQISGTTIGYQWYQRAVSTTLWVPINSARGRSRDLVFTSTLTESTQFRREITSTVSSFICRSVFSNIETIRINSSITPIFRTPDNTTVVTATTYTMCAGNQDFFATGGLSYEFRINGVVVYTTSGTNNADIVTFDPLTDFVSSSYSLVSLDEVDVLVYDLPLTASATIDSEACSYPSATVTVVVFATPSVTINPLSLNNSYCPGETVTFTITLLDPLNTDPNTTFEWNVTGGGPFTSIGTSTVFTALMPDLIAPVNTATVTVRATSPACSSTPIVSILTMEENQVISAGVISSTDLTFCSGGDLEDIVEITAPSFSVSTTSVTYQWYQRRIQTPVLPWSAIATTRGSQRDLINTSFPLTEDTQFIRETISTYLGTVCSDFTNIVSFRVDPSLVPIFNTPDGVNVTSPTTFNTCAGPNAFEARGGLSYEFRINGDVVYTTSATSDANLVYFDPLINHVSGTYTLVSGDEIDVLVYNLPLTASSTIDPDSCSFPSATVTVSISDTPSVVINPLLSNSAFCPGDTVTFTISLVPGTDSNTTFEWNMTGFGTWTYIATDTTFAVTMPNLTSPTLTVTISVQATSPSCPLTPAISTFVMEENEVMSAGIISTTQELYCSGDEPLDIFETSSPTFSAAGTVTYQWYQRRISTPVLPWSVVAGPRGELPALNFLSEPITEDTQFRRETISEYEGSICSNFTNAINLRLRPDVVPIFRTPDSSLVTTPTTYSMCEGPAEFRARNGLSYQFRINNIVVYTVGASTVLDPVTFDPLINHVSGTYTLVDGDEVDVVVYSTPLTTSGTIDPDACSFPSETVTVSVSDTPSVTITTVGSLNSYCPGETVTFTIIRQPGTSSSTQFDYIVTGITTWTSIATNTIFAVVMPNVVAPASVATITVRATDPLCPGTPITTDYILDENEVLTAGVISSTDINHCSGDEPATITEIVSPTVSTVTGTTFRYQWYERPIGGSTSWTTIGGTRGISRDLDFAGYPITVSTQYRRETISVLNGQACDGKFTGNVNLIINTAIVPDFRTPDGSTVIGPTTYPICSGTNQTFRASQGRSYEFRINGIVVYTTSSTAPANFVSFDPLIDHVSSTYTLVDGDEVDVLIYDLALTASSTIDPDACSYPSAVVTITTIPLPTPTVIATNITNNTFCPGQTVNFEINLAIPDPNATYQFDYTGNTLGLQNTPFSGTSSSFSIDLSVTNNLDISNHTTVTVYVTTPSCTTQGIGTLYIEENEITTSVVTLTSTDSSVCNGDSPGVITGTAPVATLPSTTFTYQWQQRIPPSAVWVNITGSRGESDTLDFSSHALNQTTQFRRIVRASVNSQTCEEPSPFVTINADATPLVGFKSPDGTLVTTPTTYSYCGGTNVNFEANGGLSYEFRVNNVVRYTTSSTAIANYVTFDPLADASYALQAFDVVDVIVYTLPLTTSSTIDPDSCSTQSEPISITITPTPTISIIPSTSGNIFCPGETVSFTILMIPADPTATYRYQIGTGPMISIASNTTFTAVMLDVASNTADNVSITVEVNTGACGATSQTIFLRENEIIDPGTVSGSHRICYGETPAPFFEIVSPTVAITSSTISFEWYQSTDAGVTWDLIPFQNGSGLTITNPVTVTTRYKRRTLVNASGQSCGQDGAYVEVDVIDPLVGGTTQNVLGNTSQTVCLDDPVATLEVTGTPTLTSGINYQWQISNDNFVTFSDIVSAINPTYTPPIGSTTTTYYYRRASIAQGVSITATCEAFSTVFPVYVNDLDEGSIDDSISGVYCYGSRPPLITSLVNATSSGGVVSYSWQVSTDSGATWTDIVSSNLNQYQPDPLETSSTFRRMAHAVRNGVYCREPSNQVSFTILGEVVPGALTFDQTICEGDIPQNLSIGGGTPLGGNVSYTWQDSTDGINWSDLVTNVTTYNFNATNVPTVTTYYRVKITSNVGSPSITSSENNVVFATTSFTPNIGESYGVYVDGTLYSTTLSAASSSVTDIGNAIAAAITLDPVYNATYFPSQSSSLTAGILTIQPFTPNISIFESVGASNTLSRRIRVASSIAADNVCESYTPRIEITVNAEPTIAKVSGPDSPQDICPGDNMAPIEFEVTGTYSTVVIQGLANPFMVESLPLGTGTATVIPGGTATTRNWRLTGANRFRVYGPAGATIANRNSFTIEVDAVGTECAITPPGITSTRTPVRFDYDLLVQPRPERPDVIMKDFFNTDYAVVSDTLNLWYNNTVCQDHPSFNGFGGGQTTTFYACYTDDALNLNYNEFDWRIIAGGSSISVNNNQVAEISIVSNTSLPLTAQTYQIEIDGITYTVTTTAGDSIDDLGQDFQTAINGTATTVTANYDTASNTLDIQTVAVNTTFSISVTNPPGSDATLRNPVISYPTQSATVNWDNLFGTVTNTATLRVRARGCGGSYSDWYDVQIWVVRDQVPTTPAPDMRTPVELPDLILCNGDSPGTLPTCQITGSEGPVQLFSTAITTNTNNFESLEWRITNVINTNPAMTPSDAPGTINASTGVISSWNAGFYGFFDIQVRAIACDGSVSPNWATLTHEVVVNDGTLPIIVGTGLPNCPIPTTGITTTTLASTRPVRWFINRLDAISGLTTVTNNITRELEANSDGTLTIYWRNGFDGTVIVTAEPTPCGGNSRRYAINVPQRASFRPISFTTTDDACIGENIIPIEWEILGASNGVSVTNLPAGVSANYTQNSQIVTYTLTTSASLQAGEIYTISANFTDYAYTTSVSDTQDTVGFALRDRLRGSPDLITAEYAAGELVLTGRAGVRILTAGSVSAGASGTISNPDISPVSARVRISGAPSTGVTPGDYWVNIETTSTDGCDTVTAPPLTTRITVNPDSEITTGAGFVLYNRVCFNSLMTPMNFNYFNSNTATVTGALPPGIIASASGGVVTIQGAPTINPSTDMTFTYTVETTGNNNLCNEDTFTGYIIVQPAPVINIESAPATTSSTVCVGEPLTEIVYSVSNPAYLMSPTSTSVFPPGITGFNDSRQQITEVDITTGGGAVSKTYTIQLDGTSYSFVATPVHTITDVVSSLAAQINVDTSNGVTASPTGTSFTITSNSSGVAFDLIDLSGAGGFDIDINVTQTPARFVISGSPTIGAVTITTTYIYTLTTTGGGGTCTGSATPVTGSITVKPTTTYSLTTTGSVADTTYQTLCDGNAMNTLVYQVVGATSINSNPSNPTWINHVFDPAADTLTISGTPTTGDIYQNVYEYSYTLIGSTFGCSSTSPTIEGTVVVNPDQILRLDSAAGTDAQTVCEGDTLLDPIEYEFLGSALNFNISPLPAGFTQTITPRTVRKEVPVEPRLFGLTALATETYSLRVNVNGITNTYQATNVLAGDSFAVVGQKMAARINMDPDVSATYLTSGTIEVIANTPGATLQLNTTPGNATNNIQFGTIRDTSLAGRLVIAGGPAASVVSGVYNYTITTTGANCSPMTLTGFIEVGSDSTIQLKSAPSTTNQTICDGEDIIDIVYEIGGGAANYSVVGLPDGLATNLNSSTLEVTITGTVTTDNWANKIFNYTVSTLGNVNSCDETSIGGTINVNAKDYISLVSTETSIVICDGDPITNPIIVDFWGSVGIAANIQGLPSGMYRVNTQQQQVASVSFGNPGSTSNVSDTYTLEINNTAYTYTTTTNASPNTVASNIEALITSDTLSIVTATTSGNILIVTGKTSGTTYSMDVSKGNTSSLALGTPTMIAGPNRIEILGTPNIAGSYTVTVTTLNTSCTPASVEVPIIVSSSTVFSASQSTGPVCDGTSIATVTYTMDGSTGYNISGLPNGVNDTLVGTNTIVITGTPNLTNWNNRIYTYNIESIGNIYGCDESSVNGTISVNANDYITLVSTNTNVSQCIGSPMEDIEFEYWGPPGVIAVPVTTLPPGVSFRSVLQNQVASIELTGTNLSAGDIITIFVNDTSYTYSSTTITSASNVVSAIANDITIDPLSTVTASFTGQVLTLTGNTAGVTFGLEGTSSFGASLTPTAPQMITGPRRLILEGTPTVAGAVTYTVETTGGGCSTASITGLISTIDDASLLLLSASTTVDQIVCETDLIDPIVYDVQGGGTLNVAGLPAGVTMNLAAGSTTTYEITGAPTADVDVPTAFRYSVTTTGTVGICGEGVSYGFIVLWPNEEVRLAGGSTGSAAVCQMDPIAGINLEYTASNLPLIASPTFLPNGLSLTSVTSTPQSVDVNITGVPSTTYSEYEILINGNSFISSSTVTTTLTEIIDELETKIALYSVVNVARLTPTSIRISANNAGILFDLRVISDNPGAKLNVINSNPTEGTFSITGTPTTLTPPGVYSVNITTPGAPNGAGTYCSSDTVTINITLNSSSKINLTTGSNTLVICDGLNLPNIEYEIFGGATGANVTWSPATPPWINASTPALTATPTVYSLNIGTGNPVINTGSTNTVSYSYRIDTTGNSCPETTVTGTIIILPKDYINHISSTGSMTQLVCENNPTFTPIGFEIDGGATNALINWPSGQPTGLSFVQSGTTFTITGTLSAASVASDVIYDYEIVTTGTCSPATISGTIEILALPEIALFSSTSSTLQTGIDALCENTDIAPIQYEIFGGADRAELTWLTSTVIQGISINVVSSTAGTPSGTVTLYEISGTASMSEVVATRFPYMVTAYDDDAGCTPVAQLMGVIEVLPSPTVIAQFIQDNDVTNVTCFGDADGSVIIPLDPPSYNDYERRIFGGQNAVREVQEVTWNFAPGVPQILDQIGVTINGETFTRTFLPVVASSTIAQSLTDVISLLADDIRASSTVNVIAYPFGVNTLRLEAGTAGIPMTVVDPPYFFDRGGVNPGTSATVSVVTANVNLNYQYYWYPDSTTVTPIASTLELRNRPVGTYYFEVVLNSCSSGRVPITIGGPDAPLNVDLAICNSTPTEGIINYTIEGGTQPYTVRLYREVTGTSSLLLVNTLTRGSANTTNTVIDVFNGLDPLSRYKVEVIDATGVCDDSENAFLSGGLTVDWDAIRDTIVNDSCLESPVDIGDGSISVTSAQTSNLVQGGSGSYSFSWSGQTATGSRTYSSPDINGLVPGAYTLTVFDQIYLCDISQTFYVQGPPRLEVTVDPTLTSPRELAWYPKPVTGSTSTTTATSGTGSSTSSNTVTIDELIYLNCVGDTADLAIQVTGASSTSTSSSTSTTTNPSYTVQWYSNGGSVSGTANTEVLAGQGPGIYFAEVTTSPGCTDRYYFEIREPEPFSVVFDEGRTINAGCPGDTATLYFNIIGGKQSAYQVVNYTLSLRGGLYTGSATSGDRTVVIPNVDPAVLLATGNNIAVELTDDQGCDPFTTTISMTIENPKPVVVQNVEVTDIDCAAGQLGSAIITLDLSNGNYNTDLDQLEVKWVGTSLTLPAGAPPTYRYERFVPFVPAANTRAENGRTVVQGEVYDLIYPGEYSYEIRKVSGAASGTAQICTELAVGTIVINSVGDTQLTMQKPLVQQGGCSGQTGGAITLNIDMATVVPPLEVEWYRSENVRRAVASTASSTNASGTASGTTAEPEYELVQQWVEVSQFRGQLTAFNLENGLYKATVNDQRGPGSGQCPSGAIETSVITIFDEGIELLNPTVTENYNPENCGDLINAVEGTFRFSVRDNILNSSSNDFDVELIGRAGGVIYSNTGAGSPSTQIVSQFGNGNPRIANSWQFVQLPPDEYDLLISKAGSTSNVICQETYSFTIYQYQPMEYLGDQTFLVDECLGYAEVSALVEGGLPYVIDGNAVYQYNWTLNVKEGGVFTGEQITYVGEEIKVYNEGDLSLIVYDSNGCTLELDGTTLPTLTVEFETEPFRLLPTLEDENGDMVFALPPDCGNDAENGSIGFTVEGGKPPYNIEWYIEDPLAGRTNDPHRGYRKMDIENTTFSSGLTPGNYKIVIQSLVNTCPNVDDTIFEQNIVVPLNKDLYIIDGPYVDEDLCKQLPGRIVIDIFDNLQGDLTFYYNNILVDTEVNRISDRTFTLLIPQPVPDAQLRIVNEEGCTITTDIVLGVGDPNFEFTSVNFEASGSVLAREQVTFENTSTDPFSVSEWIWGDNTPSEFVYVRSESVSPTRHEYGISGTYFATLRIYNDIGCSEEITKPIVVGKGYNILVPNVFSPNGDLVNDTFKPLFSGFSLVEFTIYDNRGNKVFYEITPGDGVPIEPENYTVPLELNGWDGSNSGNSPYYIYTVRGITLFGEKEIERSGTFIILR
ncbi:MAG: hypothetical protein ACON43_09005 [Flavobacteriaceae bacterium]